VERTRTAPPQLTDRQREVLRLIARGHTNTEIAEMLGISLAGAKWHVSELLGKFNVETREELADHWEQESGVRARARRWTVGLVTGISARAAPTAIAGVAVLGASGVAIGVLASQDSGQEPPTDVSAQAGTPAAVATETPTPDLPWTEREALAEAERFLLQHELQNVVFDADPRSSLVLLTSEFLSGIAEYESEDPEWYWRSPDGRPRDVWHFKWHAEGLSGTIAALPFQNTTLDTELWIEDGVLDAREPLADWTSLYASDGHKISGSGSLRSRLGDRLMEAHETTIGEPIRVAWYNGEADSGWLSIQETAGGWCFLRYNALGAELSGFGCGNAGPALGMAFGGETMLAADGTIATLDLYVKVPLTITTIEIVFADGRIKRHEPTGDPALPARFIYVGLGALTDPVTLIAYDSSGNEVDRHIYPRDGVPSHP
jgi:DNA-binding CsgD family transcriptional regulator